MTERTTREDGSPSDADLRARFDRLIESYTDLESLYWEDCGGLTQAQEALAKAEARVKALEAALSAVLREADRQDHDGPGWEAWYALRTLALDALEGR